MSDEGFPEFEDFLTEFKPGSKQPIANILRYREGGQYANWAAPGASVYVPGSWCMQVGSARWSGAAAVSGVREISFPAAFMDLPLLFVSAIGTDPLFHEVRLQAVLVDAGNVEVYWYSPDLLTEVVFCWMALGPVGT